MGGRRDGFVSLDLHTKQSLLIHDLLQISGQCEVIFLHPCGLGSLMGGGAEGDVHLMSFLRIWLLAQGLLINGYRLLQVTLVSWFCVQLQSAQIFASKGVGYGPPPILTLWR